MSIGRQRVRSLSATDSCRDRLAAFYHWNDQQSLRTAVQIASRNRINLQKIRRWSLQEGAETGYQEYRRRLDRIRRTGPTRGNPR
jgi:hypothetical protein